MNQAAPSPESVTMEQPSAAAFPAARGVTLRAMGVSLALIVLLCWWITYSEIKTGTTEITCTALPIGVVFALFVVCGLNTLIRARWPQKAFAPGELATIYVLVAVGSSVAGIGMLGFMTPAIANPIWFTNEKWAEFAKTVPAWWSPRDLEAVRAYYLGNSTLYTWPHVRAWLMPLAVWCGFLLVFLTMTLCLLAILRRPWIEHERLNFPIVSVPIAMTLHPEGFGGLMRSRALLFGFMVPVVIQCINNLNWLFPSIPAIPIKPTGPLDLGPKITTPPWSAVGYFPLAFHPNTIGLAYLLTTDVSFSCWFFHLLRKGLDVYSVAAGFRGADASAASARMPYSREQAVGSWICLALLTLWLARHHLANVTRQVVGMKSKEPLNASSEGMSYRLAAFGVAGCFAALVAFGVWGGIPPGVSVLFFAVLSAFVLALTRIRAEVGTAWHFGSGMTAADTVARMVGPTNLSPVAIAAMAYQQWHSTDFRSFTTPHFIEGYRMAEQGRIQARRLTGAMLLALVVGLVCASWTVLHLYYVYGASTAHVNPWRIFMGRVGFQVMEGHLSQRTTIGPDTQGMTAMGVGAVVTLLLNTARARFLRWPFHPAGYAVGNTFITDLLWFPFFLGWLAKWLTLRFGGMESYRRALPFFIGLILGDYVIASLWTFVGIVLGIDMYRCFPN